MIFYELVNFEGSYQHEAKQIRGIFGYAAISCSRWIEWAPETASIVDKPCISIVSSRNMLPKDLRKLFKACKGSVIVTYGTPLLDVEYACIDSGFSVNKLERLLFGTNIETDDNSHEMSCSINSRANIWIKTIPMPLPLMR